MKISLLSLPIAVFASLAGISHAAEAARIDRKPLSMTGSWEVGQLMKLDWEGKEDSLQMVQRVSVWALQRATINDRLSISLGLGGLFFNPYPTIIGQWGSQRKYFATGLSEVSGRYDFGDTAAPTVQVTLGYFPYKYNPDAKNLGEYLFRSSAYPNFIRTGGYEIVNSAAAVMQGLQVRHHLGNFTHDLFLTTETEFAPLHDFSLSYLAAHRFGSVLEVGAGVHFNRLIPVRASLESRKKNNNSYVEGADTSYYTFQSTKLMGRFTFDPKSLFGEPAILAREDLKIYAEAAVLGVKDYPGWYEKISERIPLLLGVNLPSFGLLDVISVEYELYKNPYPNDWEMVLKESIPIPYQRNDDSLDVNKAKTKWSIYARKDVVSGFSVFAQVASDHFRTLDGEWQPNKREVMTKKDHWYYILKFSFSI